jgi:hypothetical protein
MLFVASPRRKHKGAARIELLKALFLMRAKSSIDKRPLLQDGFWNVAKSP